MSEPSAVAARLVEVQRRIARACEAAKRDPSEVTLVAVSKRHSASMVRAAYEAGQRVFGENYVQELAQKADALRDLPGLHWRLIGPLQRNKARLAAQHAHAIDTVDRARLVNALASSERELLVQVNVSGETQKSGCRPDALEGLLAQMKDAGVAAAGLMTIAPFSDPAGARACFRGLRELADHHALPVRSMGMSGDLELAIEEGATMVRVGTAIFGARTT